MAHLSDTFSLRGVTMRNRVMVSPMCTYGSADDGLATDWHLAHYGSHAMGGAGLVMLEATAIDPDGRISHADLGIWSDDHTEGLARIATFIRAQGSVPAIQLQHAGRKASTRRPWDGGGPLDETDICERGEAPWQAIGPSPVPFGPDKPMPREITGNDMAVLLNSYRHATRRAVEAGFDVIELHAAHGYLLNQFLSPIANHREDDFGGTIENRMRFPLEVIDAVRAEIPADRVLAVRISAVDGVEEGWTLEDSVVFCQALKAHGVDLIDCSSGGIGGIATMNRLARSPGFQVPYAEEIRAQVGLPTVAVGLILSPEQAQEVVAGDRADIVAIGREILVNPNWPNMALTALSGSDSFDHWPPTTGWWLDRRAGIIRDYEAEKARAAGAL